MTIALATDEFYGNVLLWSGGNSDDDNDVVVQTEDVWHYDTFLIFSTAGVLDVTVTFDGSNYSTAPLSLTDMGAAASAPVLITVANRVYGFKGRFNKIRVLQASATDTENVILVCARNFGD